MKKWIVIGMVGLIGLSFLGWGINVWVTQNLNRVTIVHDAQRQIAVNNHFHQMLANIHSDITQLDSDKQNLMSFMIAHPNSKDWSYQDQQQYSELTTNINQDQTDIGNLVHQYNEDMRNPDWVGADSSLPHEIDTEGNPIYATPTS